jgi:hypothetical protein
MKQKGGLTPAGGDSAYRRSLYRGFLDLLVELFSETVLQTRRCGSAFPSGGVDGSWTMRSIKENEREVPNGTEAL